MFILVYFCLFLCWFFILQKQEQITGTLNHTGEQTDSAAAFAHVHISGTNHALILKAVSRPRPLHITTGCPPWLMTEVTASWLGFGSSLLTQTIRTKPVNPIQRRRAGNVSVTRGRTDTLQRYVSSFPRVVAGLCWQWAEVVTERGI